MLLKIDSPSGRSDSILLLGLLVLLCAGGGFVSCQSPVDYNPQKLQQDELTKAQDFSVPGQNTLSGLVNDTRSTFNTVLRNLSRFIPVSVEYAEDVGKNCSIFKFNQHYYGSPALVFAAVLFVVGALFCFVGYRLLKVNLFLIGFLIGGGFAYLIFLAFLVDVEANWKLYAALAITAVVGAIAGFITIAVYYIGMFLAGGSVGFLITWFLLSVINIQYLQNHIYIPFLVAIGVGIVCGIVTIIFQKWPVIIGTSVIGAFLISWSIDYYLELGLMMYYLLLFAENRKSLKPCWYSWTIIGLFVLIGLAGLILQGAVTGRKYDHKKDLNDKGICCGLCKRIRKKEKRSGNYMPLKEMD